MKQYGLQRTDTNEYYTQSLKNTGMGWIDDIRQAHSWKTIKALYELFDITSGNRQRNNYIRFRTFMKDIPVQIVEFEIKSSRVQTIEIWKSIK